MHITRSHIMESETHTVAQTSKQDARILAMASESQCSSPAIQGYKTVFYSSCNDAKEVTCLSGMKEEKTLLKHDGNSEMCTNPNTSPFLTEKTIYSGEDSMDITKSHTVATNNILKQDHSRENELAVPMSEKEVMLQGHITLPDDGKMNLNCSPVPQVSMGRLLQSPANSLSTSLTDKKTKIDLTESHTSNLRSQALTSYDLAPENITKSDSKSLSDNWKKVAKSLNQPSQHLDKNILIDTQAKEKHHSLKISSCLDEDSLSSVHYNQDSAAAHNRAWWNDKQVVLGHKEQGQHPELSDPQKKNLNEPTSDCFHDEMICSEEEQPKDLSKRHTVVIGFGPSEVQELNKSNLEPRISQLPAVSRKIAIKVSPLGKTRVIVTNDMAELEDRIIQKPGFLKEKQNVNKICGRKSVGGLKIDKTI